MYDIDFRHGRWAPKSQEAYSLWWRHAVSWCAENERLPLPISPQTLADYLLAQAPTHKVATLQMMIGAIKAAHKIMKAEFSPDSEDAKRFTIDVEHPAFADTWATIRRQYGTRNTPKKPLQWEDIKLIVTQLRDSFIERRAKAMILVAFGAALRRGELVALDVEELTFSGEGVALLIRRSKTDQAGAGRVLRIPRNPTGLCIVGELEAWLSYARIETGPVFRARDGARCVDRVYADAVKHAVSLIGKDRRLYSGHSTRRGYVTDAFEKGAPPESIRDKTRHADLNMVLRYRESAQVFDSPADKAVLGL